MMRICGVETPCGRAVLTGSVLTVDEQQEQDSVADQHNTHGMTRMLSIGTPICCLAVAGVTWTHFRLPIINQNIHLDFYTPAQSPKLLPSVSCVR